MINLQDLNTEKDKHFIQKGPNKSKSEGSIKFAPGYKKPEIYSRLFVQGGWAIT